MRSSVHTDEEEHFPSGHVSTSLKRYPVCSASLARGSGHISVDMILIQGAIHLQTS